MLKKLSIALLALLTLTITGCGAKEKKDEKIVVWSQASAESPEGKMFEDRIKKYNETHSEKMQVEISNITRAGAGSGYIDRLNASIAANTMPDIFTLDGPDVSAYVDSGVIGPLDANMSQGFKDGFTSAMIQEGTVNGEFYAMPYSDSGVIISYNEDMIKVLPENIKAMIPKSNEDWTWDKFVEVLQKVDDFAKTTKDPAFKDYKVAVSTAVGSIATGGYEIGTYFYAPLIWSNGSNIISNDGITTNEYMNNDKTIDAITKFAKLFDKTKPLATATEPENAFATGKTAFAVAGFWYFNDFVSNYPNLKFKSLRYPKMSVDFKDLYTPSGSWAFVRNANIKDENKVKQVVEVMEWLTNDEAAKEYFVKNGSIPTRKASIDVINTNTPNPYFNEAWSVLKYQVSNTNKARPISPGYPYLSETFSKDVILKIAQNNTSSPEQVKEYLQKASEKIDLELKKYKK
ncbi:MAG: extracellular solute-binding protein [Fusobacteriaceae bacterium]|nr:extracellular solute-binding protein [Fusobacteriaceae bacterium]MBN2837744.1 extracellular solute-binding protein [Fusobacteriaceae bacterium]